MSEPLLDLAVYLVPPEEHEIYRVCAAVLGWDCRRERAVERMALPGIPPDLLAEWVGPAAKFGPHGTVGGWMRVPSRHRDRIVDEMREVAASFGPIALTRGRFAAPGDYWHPATAPSPILVAAFDELTGMLDALHAEVVVRFNRLAVSSTQSDRIDAPIWTPRERARLARYHEARVLEGFRFHVSFATGTPGPDAVDRLRRAIVDATGLFSRREHTTWTAAELFLFERGPDGFWRMPERFAFSGG